MIKEEVIAIGEELADIQRGGEILVAEGRHLSWDQDHGDGIMPNLAGPLQIPWMYSRKCNFRCKHCYNNSVADYAGKYDADPCVIADRIIEAKPYSACLCGGEPFMWERLYEIIERLRKGGIPLVSLVSNGFYCTPDALAKARDCGLTTIQFSIDGTSAEQHGRLHPEEGAWERVMAALEDALRYSWVDMSISMIPNRYNIRDVKQYITHFTEMGVKHLRFQPLMLLGRATQHAKELQPTDSEYMQFHFDLLEMQMRYPQVLVDWGDPLEHIWFYAFTEAGCWTSGISTDGWLELSPYLPFLVGDVKKHSIHEIWAKGLKGIWQSPLVKRLARQVSSTSAMGKQEVRIYEEESLHIDVFDEEQWNALMTTEDIEVFKGFSKANLERERS